MRPVIPVVSWLVRCSRTIGLLAGAVLVSSCEGEEPTSASKYAPPDAPHCTGAYTPKSDVCWDENDGGERPITPNAAAAMERAGDHMGNRCTGRIVGAPGTEGTLTVSFATTRLGGMYTPSNCGAVWIEDDKNAYIRTLNVWAGVRQMAVVAWFSSVCTTDALIDDPDVTTSATLPKPQAHTTTWDTKDYQGRVTPDGVYTLWMEVTESELPHDGPYMQTKFVKGPQPFTLTPDAEPGFENIALSYTPTEAAAVAP